MAQLGCLTYTSISGLKDSTPGQMEVLRVPFFFVLEWDCCITLVKDNRII